ncbi:MAG: rhodanese-like domain-containing protein [Pseudomonadota bacterium]
MIKTADDLIRDAQQHIQCVDATTAKQLFDETPDTMVVDVREADSAEKSKLEVSTHISRGLIEMKLPKLCDNPDQLILTHCGGGGRASLAAYSLQQMGYTNVRAITAPYDEIKKIFG